MQYLAGGLGGSYVAKRLQRVGGGKSVKKRTGELFA